MATCFRQGASSATDLTTRSWKPRLWLTLGGGLHRSNEGHLVLRAAPDLAARSLATEVGVVDLHPALVLARVLTHAHDLHELVFHEPGAP